MELNTATEIYAGMVLCTRSRLLLIPRQILALLLANPTTAQRARVLLYCVSSITGSNTATAPVARRAPPGGRRRRERGEDAV